MDRLVIVAIIVMINLGFWQLRRLDERQAFNAAVEERSAAPPVPLDALLADPDLDVADAEWRQVTVEGEWLDDQILVFNRSQGGVAGDNVLSTLVNDELTVLVNRGFIPLASDVPPSPDGPVEILGRVRASQTRQTGGLTDEQGDVIIEVRRVNVDALAPQLPGEVAPVFLDLIASEPPVGSDDPAPVPPPELGEGNHLSYAVQWFIFALLAGVGWVLAVRRSVNNRRRQASSEAMRRNCSTTSELVNEGSTVR
jgi:cytochrome oxidase assembly protein ShyY1